MFKSSYERLCDAWSRPRTLAPDRVALILVMMLGVGSVISWQYHFFFQNYGTFLVEQVLPALGRVDVLEEALDSPARVGTSSEVRLDRWPLSSPYFRNYNTHHDRLNPVGSDYLGVWHYERELLRGRDPYAFSLDYFTYNEQVGGWPVVIDPSVPAQHVGAFSYFPGSLLVLLPFYHPSYFVSFFIYLACLHLFLIVCAALLARANRPVAVPLAMTFGTLLFTCFPLGVLVDRGNTEGVLLMLVASAIYAYQRERYHLSAGLIALAACAKLYPAIFFALFLLDRRWLPLLTGLATGLAATLGTMLCMHAPLTTLVHELLSHLGGFNAYFLLKENSVRFNHTLYNLIKGTAFCDLRDRNPTEGLQHWAAIYPWLILPLTLFVLWRLQRLGFAQRVLCLCVAMLTFPYVSYDYTLVHLLVPFALFLTALLRMPRPSLRAFAPVFVMVFVFLPKEYLVELYGRRWGIGFACNAIALLLLLLLGLTASGSATEEAAL